jgi:hypothetical protein
MKYSGIDLHSNNAMIAVIDDQDRVLYCKRLANDLSSIIAVLAPFHEDLQGVVVESTYNWYWLVDGLMAAGFAVHLANTSAIKQYEGLKYAGKHDVAARRTWRKLHLAVDEHHQIVACELTTQEVGDPTAVPDLLAQIVTPFKTFMGDGAYDGEPVSQAVLNHQPNAQVVIPPHKTAVLSGAGDTQRDHHIQVIAQQGRLAWQKITGYGMRNYVELAMQRYKRIFGNTMKARALPQQKTEAWISVSALIRMTNLGMPVSVKV